MNEFVVKAQKRTETGKSAVKKLRSTGMVPGICYGGHNNEGPVMFSLDRKEFSKILRSNDDNFIVTLDLDGSVQKTMVRDFQVNHLTDELLHVDLNRISMKDKIEVEVHVELTGEPAGVTSGDGVLQHVVRSIHVKCLPTDIPEHLTVDVSGLGLGDAVRVEDLQLDKAKVEVLTEGDVVIASVTHGISEDDMNVQLEEGEAQPEVIGGEADAAAGDAADGGDKKE